MSRSELNIPKRNMEDIRAQREAHAKLSQGLESVRFVQRYKMYNPGESAGFPADFARRLIEAGIAQAVPKAKAKKAKK